MVFFKKSKKAPASQLVKQVETEVHQVGSIFEMEARHTKLVDPVKRQEIHESLVF